MFNQFRVTATFERDGAWIEMPFSHSFDHLSEALIWKAGLAAIYPDARITITDPDGYAVAEATQQAFLLNM